MRKDRLKKHDVTLTTHYEKDISVYAGGPEEAREKPGIALFDTDFVNFFDENFVCGEADITDPLKNGNEKTKAEDDCCPGCPHYCHVRGECMYGDGD